MAKDRCTQCGGRLDRPGLFKCDFDQHPTPDMAQMIVAAIEADFRDRRGLRMAFEMIDDDVQEDIRDEWVDIVREFLVHSIP